MYIPQDPPLVLHMPTSWQPASQPVTSPHACAEVGLGSDSKKFAHLNCQNRNGILQLGPNKHAFLKFGPGKLSKFFEVMDPKTSTTIKYCILTQDEIGTECITCSQISPLRLIKIILVVSAEGCFFT